MALRAGLTVEAFWSQTPRETTASLAAVSWQREREQRRDLALAWHIAALSRSRRMPSLSQLLAPREARQLHGAELEQRKREHSEMQRNLQIGKWQIANRQIGKSQIADRGGDERDG